MNGSADPSGGTRAAARQPGPRRTLPCAWWRRQSPRSSRGRRILAGHKGCRVVRCSRPDSGECRRASGEHELRPSRRLDEQHLRSGPQPGEVLACLLHLLTRAYLTAESMGVPTDYPDRRSRSVREDLGDVLDTALVRPPLCRTGTRPGCSRGHARVRESATAGPKVPPEPACHRCHGGWLDRRSLRRLRDGRRAPGTAAPAGENVGGET